MTQATDVPGTILDLLGNLASYDPTLYPLARFVSSNSSDTFQSNGLAWIPEAGGAGGALFIFTPGAPQSGIVFGDWAQLAAVLAALPTGTNPAVRFTASFTIPATGMPASGWDLAGGTLESYSRETGLVQVTIPDGVSLLNCGGIWNGMVVNIAPTVALSPQGTFRYPASMVGQAMIFIIGFSSAVAHTGTGPMIVSPGAGSSTAIVVALDMANQGLAPPLGGPFVELNGNDGAVGVQFNCGPLGGMPDNWLVGGGPGSGLTNVRGIDATFPPIPGFTGGGGINDVNGTRAVNLNYAPNPANWLGAPPATVQAALDRLAASVAFLLGGPIP